ncbi:MAG: hypothetical protein VYC83_08805, partial [Chloroflexota bacterium]|nr:hypothetical protein [Chloroflexota bacterium]
ASQRLTASSLTSKKLFGKLSGMAFLLQKMSDILGGGLWAHPAGQVVVHGHNRGLGTSPKTGVHSHSEALVWSVAFIFHAGGFQDGLEDAHRA